MASKSRKNLQRNFGLPLITWKEESKTLFEFMRDYFIRRLLLIPPTLLGISIMVFAITRLAPGGPLEQAMMQMQQVSQDGGGGQGMGSDQSLSQDQMEQMKRLYGFDKPHWEAYLIWLGVMPRETEFRQIRFSNFEFEISERVRIPDFQLAELDWNGDGYVQRGEIPKKISRCLSIFKLNKFVGAKYEVSLLVLAQ